MSQGIRGASENLVESEAEVWFLGSLGLPLDSPQAPLLMIPYEHRYIMLFSAVDFDMTVLASPGLMAHDVSGQYTLVGHRYWAVRALQVLPDSSYVPRFLTMMVPQVVPKLCLV